MLTGTCHCGACRWTLAAPPASVTACSCTICRRFGALWAYGFLGKDVTVSGDGAMMPPGAVLPAIDTAIDHAAYETVTTMAALQAMIDSSKELSTGWKQRLTSLLPSVDPEQILAKLRTDGATWFQPDFGLHHDTAELDDIESDVSAELDDLDHADESDQVFESDLNDEDNDD